MELHASVSSSVKQRKQQDLHPRAVERITRGHPSRMLSWHDVLGTLNYRKDKVGPGTCIWEMLHSDSNLQTCAAWGEAVISRPFPGRSIRSPRVKVTCLSPVPSLVGGRRPTWEEARSESGGL